MSAEDWVDVDATPTAFQALADVQQVKAQQQGLEDELRKVRQQQASMLAAMDGSKLDTAVLQERLDEALAQLRELHDAKVQQEKLAQLQDKRASRDEHATTSQLHQLQQQLQHQQQAGTQQANLTKQVQACEKQQALVQEGLQQEKQKHEKVAKKLQAVGEQQKQLAQKLDEKVQALQEQDSARAARLDALTTSTALPLPWKAWCVLGLLVALVARREQGWKYAVEELREAVAAMPAAAPAASEDQVAALEEEIRALKTTCGAFERVGSELRLAEDLRLSANLFVQSDEVGKGNVVVGKHNDVSEASNALVAGYQNVARGAHVSVLGGYENLADGEYAAVLGGQGNTAKGEAAAVLGGLKNMAEGPQAAVAGGWLNVAKGDGSAVAGGKKQTAHRRWSLGDDSEEHGDEAFDHESVWGKMSSMWGGDELPKDKKKEKKDKKDKKEKKKKSSW